MIGQSKLFFSENQIKKGNENLCKVAIVSKHQATLMHKEQYTLGRRMHAMK
jgi:hypothetical protein